MDQSATWHDFARVYATSKGWCTSHPDLAGFHERRYAVYRELIGVDPTDTTNFDRKKLILHEAVWERLATKYHHRVHPFSGILAAPKPAITIINRYVVLTEELVEREKQLYLDAMSEAATLLWGPCPRVVTDAELEQRGVGKSTEPDPNWY